MKSMLIAAGILAALSAAGCQKPNWTAEAPAMHHMMGLSVSKATATIAPTGKANGAKIGGTLLFTDVDGGVKIEGTITGLAPNSSHGFHIHELGDVSGVTDGLSVGGHYDPSHSHQHGGPETANHHTGDLGNVTADKDGNAKVSVVIKDISISGANNPILGRSVVLHANKDTFEPPTGLTGDRIAFGVIGIAKTEEPKPSLGTAPAK